MTERLERMRSEGGVPHAAVHQEMLDDMEGELRQMVRDYTGADGQAKELLEALVIARENGVKACDEIEHDLGQRATQDRLIHLNSSVASTTWSGSGDSAPGVVGQKKYESLEVLRHRQGDLLAA